MRQGVRAEFAPGNKGGCKGFRCRGVTAAVLSPGWRCAAPASPGGAEPGALFLAKGVKPRVQRRRNPGARGPAPLLDKQAVAPGTKRLPAGAGRIDYLPGASTSGRPPGSASGAP